MEHKNTGNINSFADNIAKTLRGQANMISLLSAIQQSTAENTDTVNYTYEDLEGNTQIQQLPTYASLSHKIDSIEKTFNDLATGRGTLRTSDQNRYSIKIETVPQTPSVITGVNEPTTFSLDSNWFFESLMFPGAVVTVDLTGQVSAEIKEVQVLRVIVDSTKAAHRNFWNNTLSANQYSYIQLIQLFEDNNIAYSEDLDIVQLPKVNNNYYGTFMITQDPELINNNFYYTLDTIKYRTVSAAGVDYGNNNLLNVGDELYYTGALYEIIEIDQKTNKVRLRQKTGSALPGKGGQFTLFRDPEKSKKLNIRFGANEYNFIFIKAVSPDNNILANEWSPCVKFNSSELTYALDSDVKFSDFYDTNIVDWGAKMLAEAKERKIAAFEGKTPNAPKLNASDFKVVIINDHLRYNIGLQTIKDKLSSISAEKATIDALNLEIAEQKTSLRTATTVEEYNAINDVINTNTVSLNNRQTNYSSLINAFRTDNDYTRYLRFVPKYRIRGFFPLPDPVYYGIGNQRIQEVIGFEIRYRYISANTKKQPTLTEFDTNINSAADLKNPGHFVIKKVSTTGIRSTLAGATLSQNAKVSLLNNNMILKPGVATPVIDKDSLINNRINVADEIKVAALFSTWNIIKSKVKERVYDKDKGCYVWASENITDGSEININQVDIPIKKGESVQIQVRSISEAGYPENPLKSEWSNIVTVNFDNSVEESDDELDKITDLVQSDYNRSEFVNILNQNGLIAHISDSIMATDALSSNNFNHQAKFIAYIDKDADNNIQAKSMQDKIEELETKLSDMTLKYNKLLQLVEAKVGTTSGGTTTDTSNGSTGDSSTNNTQTTKPGNMFGIDTSTFMVAGINNSTITQMNPITAGIKNIKSGGNTLGFIKTDI